MDTETIPLKQIKSHIFCLWSIEGANGNFFKRSFPENGVLFHRGNGSNNFDHQKA